MKKEIDVEGFRGKLPSYLRQGIPPYLQILFSARAPLPFVPPVFKPHKINLQGFFNSLDYNQISENLTKKREERMEKNHERIEKERMILQKISYKEKREKWKKNMKEHIKKTKKSHKEWLEKKFDKTNKTDNPFKTLIVYKLVS